MLISIITPTFNSEKTIKETIRSVISQTYKNYEHIIVDNQSKDNTLELITKIYEENGSRHKLKIICEKDNGISDAFNKGIINSSGEIIGILNSDDTFYDNSILSLVHKALSNRDKLMVHGNIYFEDLIFGSNIRFPLKHKIMEVGFNHPGMFVKREVYDKIGLYNIALHYAMDVDLFLRLRKEYKNIEQVSSYLNYSLVTMKAGGASWKNELKALKEVRQSIIANKMWNINSAIEYWGRVLRTRIKSVLTILRLQRFVNLWRNYKWKT
jgi:glycosyltransferase involved in cell wall biosynthesis